MIPTYSVDIWQQNGLRPSTVQGFAYKYKSVSIWLCMQWNEIERKWEKFPRVWYSEHFLASPSAKINTTCEDLIVMSSSSSRMVARYLSHFLFFSFLYASDTHRSTNRAQVWQPGGGYKGGWGGWRSRREPIRPGLWISKWNNANQWKKRWFFFNLFIHLITIFPEELLQIWEIGTKPFVRRKENNFQEKCQALKSTLIYEEKSYPNSLRREIVEGWFS